MDEGFHLLESIINFTNKRHKVIASNIANIDTPDFQAGDLAFRKIFNEEILGLSNTHEFHITLETEKSRKNGAVKFETNEVWGDRNNVELDIEVAKMIKNALLNKAGVELFSKKIRMFKEAVRGR